MFEDLKRVSNKHKNNKFKYYLEGYFNTYAPKFLFRCLLKSKLSAQKQFDSDYLQMRIDYYNRLNHVTMLPDESIALKNFKLPKRPLFKKLICDHKSERLFSTGVPVNTNLRSEFSAQTDL